MKFWEWKCTKVFGFLPSKTGDKSKMRRCGSSVAPRKPIEALAAIMLIAHTIIPGIFNKDSIEAANAWISKINIKFKTYLFCLFIPIYHLVVRVVWFDCVLAVRTTWWRPSRTAASRVWQMVNSSRPIDIRVRQPSVPQLILIQRMSLAMRMWRLHYPEIPLQW